MDGLFVIKNKDTENVKLICCMLCFVFIFIILIIAIAWTNYDTFENFGNIIGCNQETVKNVLSGGIHYISLNPTDDLFKKVDTLQKKDQVGLIAVLAPWCGYCKRLKSSGILVKIAKKYPVIVIDDKHPQTQDVMNILQAEGFPSLGVIFQGNLLPYRGPRDIQYLMQTLNEYQGQLKPTGKESFTNKSNLKGQITEVPNNITPEMLMEQIKVNYSKGHDKICTVFMADWCGHCKMLKNSKTLENLAHNGTLVYTINEKNPLTEKMNIRGFPTIICWKGSKYKNYEGDRSANSILKFMQSL